jgi:DNA-binding transcriptional LysR family regulator
VAAGLGVALIPEGFARARPAKGLAIHELDPPLRRPIGAIVASGEIPALVQAFLDALEKETDLARSQPTPKRRRRRPAE